MMARCAPPDGREAGERDGGGAAAAQPSIPQDQSPSPRPSSSTFHKPTNPLLRESVFSSKKHKATMALSMKTARVQARSAGIARKPVVAVRAAAAAAGEVPSPEKRTTMNLILAGGVGLPVVGLAGPVSSVFALLLALSPPPSLPLTLPSHSPPTHHSTCRSSCPARESGAIAAPLGIGRAVWRWREEQAIEEERATAAGESAPPLSPSPSLSPPAFSPRPPHHGRRILPRLGGAARETYTRAPAAPRSGPRASAGARRDGAEREVFLQSEPSLPPSPPPHDRRGRRPSNHPSKTHATPKLTTPTQPPNQQTTAAAAAPAARPPRTPSATTSRRTSGSPPTPRTRASSRRASRATRPT